MTHMIKDTFYKEKLYQLSLTSFSMAETQMAQEKSHLKEVQKQVPYLTIENQGIPVEILETSLGNFGKTAEGPHYSYLSFNCINQNLYSIVGLEKFRHLQHIDVSHNNLTSLKTMSSLRYVVHLNCSYNRLSKLLDFKVPPLQLMFVDSSHNEIEEMSDMTMHRFLKHLNLSDNRITDVGGIQQNKYLQVLNLSNNRIEYIQNLDDMNLTELHLAGNQITQPTGLTRLLKLRKLDLTDNGVIKLVGLVELISLRELRLANNRVRRARELTYLENLVYLSVLDLSGNPIQTRKYYRMQVLYRLPGLRNLDNMVITPEDIVKAENLYGMDLEDRKRIFKDILPEEEFIDRRIHVSETIDPETDSENDDQDFIDRYDKEGRVMEKQSRNNFEKSLSEMYHTGKSLQERPETMTMKSFKSQN